MGGGGEAPVETTVPQSVYSARRDVFIEAIDFQSLDTNAATVARVFLRGVEARVKQPHDIPWKQFSLGATTASQSAAPAGERKEIREYIPTDTQLMIEMGTDPTDGWDINVLAGDHYARRALAV